MSLSHRTPWWCLAALVLSAVLSAGVTYRVRGTPSEDGRSSTPKSSADVPSPEDRSGNPVPTMPKAGGGPSGAAPLPASPSADRIKNLLALVHAPGGRSDRVVELEREYGVPLSDEQAATVMAIEETYDVRLKDLDQKRDLAMDELVQRKMVRNEIYKTREYYVIQNKPSKVVIAKGVYPDLDRLYAEFWDVDHSIRSTTKSWIERYRPK